PDEIQPQPDALAAPGSMQRLSARTFALTAFALKVSLPEILIPWVRSASLPIQPGPRAPLRLRAVRAASAQRLKLSHRIFAQREHSPVAAAHPQDARAAPARSF